MGHAISTVFLLEYIKTSNSIDRRIYYTREEISKHNNENSLWIVAGNKVFDITSFYKQQTHPGGCYPLQKRAGGSIDSAPDLKFHSKKTRKLWNNYLIGYVKED